MSEKHKITFLSWWFEKLRINLAEIYACVCFLLWIKATLFSIIILSLKSLCRWNLWAMRLCGVVLVPFIHTSESWVKETQISILYILFLIHIWMQQRVLAHKNKKTFIFLHFFIFNLEEEKLHFYISSINKLLFWSNQQNKSLLKMFLWHLNQNI